MGYIMNQNIIALLAGTLFGAGLAASGMNDSAVVQGFLDVSGDWNPSLMFVMAAALFITVPGFLFMLKRKPVLASHFNLPSFIRVDRPLIIGSIIFGMGWALVGYCPGPAIAALGYLNWESVMFVLAMLAGSKLRQWQVSLS
jgi:uncharacterized membrane protein YedE/YeeE